MKASGLSKPVKPRRIEVSAESSRDDAVVLDGSQVLVCSNDACGRNIAEPIRVENLGASPAENYYACPYCLSKVDMELDETIKRQEIVKRITAEIPKKVEINVSSECNYHFGYLKTRPKNTPVPDSCFMCPRMMDCL